MLNAIWKHKDIPLIKPTETIVPGANVHEASDNFCLIASNRKKSSKENMFPVIVQRCPPLASSLHMSLHYVDNELESYNIENKPRKISDMQFYSVISQAMEGPLGLFPPKDYTIYGKLTKNGDIHVTTVTFDVSDCPHNGNESMSMLLSCVKEAGYPWIVGDHTILKTPGDFRRHMIAMSKAYRSGYYSVQSEDITKCQGETYEWLKFVTTKKQIESNETKDN